MIDRNELNDDFKSWFRAKPFWTGFAIAAGIGFAFGAILF